MNEKALVLHADKAPEWIELSPDVSVPVIGAPEGRLGVPGEQRDAIGYRDVGAVSATIGENESAVMLAVSRVLMAPDLLDALKENGQEELIRFDQPASA